MTKRLILLAVATSAIAAPVSAQTAAPVAARTMSVIGSTPKVCAMQRGRIQPGGLVNINGLDGDTLRITQLTDTQTLAARAASVTINFEAFCNFPHQVRLESQNNGLFPTDGRLVTLPTSSVFASALPYEARLTWGDTSGQLSANAKLRQITRQLVSVGGATAGDLQVRIEVQQGASNTTVSAPLLAGSYGDTLRIFLEPR